MLSLPHLVVLFVVALMVFGPEKLPELARMLGKATAEFRKMTNDFRYALEDEVRELERATRIREEESAAAARVAQVPATLPSIASEGAPEGAVPREPTAPAESAPAEEPSSDPSPATDASASSLHPPAETVSVPHEKSSDDNTAV